MRTPPPSGACGWSVKLRISVTAFSVTVSMTYSSSSRGLSVRLDNPERPACSPRRPFPRFTLSTHQSDETRRGRLRGDFGDCVNPYWIKHSVARRPTRPASVSYTHLRAHETVLDLVCRLLLEKKKKIHTHNNS